MGGPDVRDFTSPNWSPLPLPGARDVEGRVLTAHPELVVAELRLGPLASVPEHATDHETEVLCLDGTGFTSIEGRDSRIYSGQRVNWPAGKPHRLWTQGSAMRVLMIEHPEPYRP